MNPPGGSGPPALVCIAGPTASGKSRAALALAERFPIEIVSVDSALVYRGMDIGTAKPSSAERGRVAHHLIDLIDASEGYSAARFCADARSAIDAIRQRGRIPILVGGTMLYFKALREGLDALPGADPGVRRQLEATALQEGWPALHEALAAVDPVTAARLAPTDAQRIQRALEVWQVSGRTLSSYFTDPLDRKRSGESFVMISLEPADRAVLHDRIADRFTQMLEEGLIGEVEGLRARGDLHLGLPSMRCVGYRQVWQYLAGEHDRATMQARAIAATRQLAKRQLTWLRGLPERQRIDCLDPDAGERVLTLVAPLLERAASCPQSVESLRNPDQQAS